MFRTEFFLDFVKEIALSGFKEDLARLIKNSLTEVFENLIDGTKDSIESLLLFIIFSLTLSSLISKILQLCIK